MNFIEFLQSHLIHALPILIVGAFAVAIILERVKALFLTYPLGKTEDFFEKISILVMSGKIQEAERICDKHSEKPVARVVKTGLMRSHLPETVIEDGLQLVTNEATQAILRRTSFLATIANVATLLGLFGTIAGLISAFEAVGHADAQQKSALLSAGIATSMNATMLGLAVSIPCMIAYSFLMNRSQRLIAQVQSSAVRTLDILKQRFYATESHETPETSVNTTTPTETHHENGKSTTARRSA